MARFRCPSASTISSSGSMNNVNNAERAKPTPSVARLASIAEESESNHRSPSLVRTRSSLGKLDRTRSLGHIKNEEKDKVRMAQKKAEVKEHHREVSFVFVGNVSSSATEDQLKEVFKTVGPIRRLTIRACHGLAVPTAKLPRSFWGLGPRLEGIHYAIVHFFKPAAAKKAIGLNQRVFMGKPLVVTFDFTLLPEVEVIVTSHLDKYRKYTPREDLEYAMREALGVCKRLTYQKTEIISDPQPAKPAQARTSGTSTGVLHRATRLVRRAGLYGSGPSGSSAAQQHYLLPSRAEPNL